MVLEPCALSIRLVHHCHIVGIKGESYRQKQAAARVSSDQSDPPT
ncbi:MULTISPECIES: ATP-binding protein [unclassified Cyanobium]|nr:ATP-binding protein [Cyanobium sp. BA20m-14]